MDLHALRKRGSSVSVIARHLGDDRKTIRAYLNDERVAGVRAPAGQDRFAPFVEYCRARLMEDPHLWAETLLDEVHPLGFVESYATFTRQLRMRGLRPHCEACSVAKGVRSRSSSTRPGRRPSGTRLNFRTRRRVGVGTNASLFVGALAHPGRWRGQLEERRINHRPSTRRPDHPRARRSEGPWGSARERVVRCAGGEQRRCPRRTLCVGCRATHVLIWEDMLLRGRDEVAVIGAALTAKAAGHGYRYSAVVLGVPVSTVRGWLPRFVASVVEIRVWFTVLAHDLDGMLGALQRAEELLSESNTGRAALSGRADDNEAERSNTMKHVDQHVRVRETIDLQAGRTAPSGAMWWACWG